MNKLRSAAGTLLAATMATGFLLTPEAAGAAPRPAAPGNFFHLVEKQQNRCLDVAGGQTVPDASLIRSNCSNTDRQLWSPQVVTANIISLSSRRSGLCMDAATANFGDHVVQNWCDGRLAQRWERRPVFVGSELVEQLVSQANTSMCLDTIGAYVAVFPCTAGNLAQSWRFVF
jgi:hypothetical protein